MKNNNKEETNSKKMSTSKLDVKSEREREHSDKINKVLDGLEKELGIVILFAADAGSRAYGWSSGTSDFDVHMIYTHHSTRYLTIQTKADNYGEMTRMMKMKKKYLATKYLGKEEGEEECDVECNVTGYELSQFLTLYSKSNPAMVHTVSTPIIYRSFVRDELDFGTTVIEMGNRDVSRRVMVQSLLNLAKVKNTSKYLLAKNDTVRLKVYLYILHHLLYIGYIHNNPSSETLPPLEIKYLLADSKMSRPVRRIVFHLLRLKTNNESNEEIYVPRYIYLELYLFTLWRKYYKWAFTLDRHFMAVDPLDKLFRKTLKLTDPLLKDIDLE